MTRTDRALLVVRLLMTRPRYRAGLADTVEVSERTIRRVGDDIRRAGFDLREEVTACGPRWTLNP